MADIKVTLSSNANQPNLSAGPQEPEKLSQKFSIKLKARKTLDGSIIISDHPEVDIVIVPEKMKVISFSKENFDDTVYETQNRLMKFLFKRGVIVFDSVCGGNIYGSLEAKIQKPDAEYPIDDLLLMVISDWIAQEKPSYLYQKSIEDTYVDSVTNPDDEHSTELGDVEAAPEKGSVPIHQVRRYAYGL